MCAVGPPNDVRPSRSAAANTSVAEPVRDGVAFSPSIPVRGDRELADRDAGRLQGGADVERRPLA